MPVRTYEEKMLRSVQAVLAESELRPNPETTGAVRSPGIAGGLEVAIAASEAAFVAVARPDVNADDVIIAVTG